MKKRYFNYLIITASFVLLILNLLNLDFDDLLNENYLGIISNILLIIAMYISLKDNSRKD
ncbi:hypothetical protein UJ101_02008 [Flavobacteriaceae bacterium UJ101]|nr:hypothetical protein UJ101_02008 [Flavobacteriaceae bacterium UJ101]